MQFSSIKQQILLFGGASLLAVAGATVSYGYYSGSDLSDDLRTVVLADAEHALKESLSLSADVKAKEITIVFNQAMDLATNLASSFKHEHPGISRQSVSALLKNSLQSNPKVLSIYSGWEQNQFDGLDTENTSNNYSQKSGNFAPYWSRNASGNLNLQALGDFYATKKTETGIRASEWYLCPQETKQACVIDPASYNVQGVQTLLSSFVTPVVRDGKYLGMFGVDYSLNFLQSLAENMAQDLLSGQSQVIILSSGGIVSADSSNKANIGKPLATTGLQKTLSQRIVGDTNTIGADLITSEQFSPNGISKPWEIIIIVPEKIALADAQAIVAKVDNGFADNLKGQLLIGSIVGILGLFLMWLVAQSISKPIDYLVARVKDLTASGGDLTHQLDIQRTDETGQLAEHLNVFIANIRQIVGNVAATSQQLSASAKISASTADSGLTLIADQQLEIEQVVTATNEMSSTAHSVSDNAQVTAQAVSETQTAVNNGQQVVEANADGLRSLSQNVTHATEVVTELESRSEGIVGILEVIRNISDQTNLLALNAAIEAARAGEQGRGFAVVADEVRNLATQTATSTDEIQEVIDALRDYSHQAVEAMQTSGDLTNACLGHATDAVEALKNISDQSCRIQDMAHQIASAAEEQAAVTEEVNRNIVAINDAAINIAEGAKTSQHESTNVAQYTNDVSNKINHFQY